MVEDEESKNAETKGGYAKEMSAEYQKKQEALLAETLKEMDIVICTAVHITMSISLRVSAKSASCFF